jgi:hypothetical protein
VRTVVSGGNPARARTSRFAAPSSSRGPSSRPAKGPGGIAAAAAIKGRLPRTTVVMLAAPRDDAQLFAALRAGAGSATSRTDSSPLTSCEWQVLDSLRQKTSTGRDRGAAVRLAGDRAQPRRLAASRAGLPIAKRPFAGSTRHRRGESRQRCAAKARRAGRERLTTHEQPEGLRILAPRMVVAATERRKSDE